MWRVDAYRVLDRLVIRASWIAPRGDDGVLRATFAGTTIMPCSQLDEGSPDELEALGIELIGMAHDPAVSRET
jgi:hypothetical protein